MDTLSNIKKWIKEHAPIVLTQLGVPASNEEIATVESVIGLELPVEFRNLLQIHNGELGGFGNLLGDGNTLLSCEDILERYNFERENCQISHTDLMQKQEWKDLAVEELISVKGSVHPHESHEKWIPFTSMNGDVIRYIDLDPAPNGSPGQIIEVDYLCQSWCVIAASFKALLEQYLSDLNNGEYRVKDNGYITKKEQDNEYSDVGVPSWLQEIDDSREFDYRYNDEDWHLDLRYDRQMKELLENIYPMNLEIFGWQNYIPSKIDNDYYVISWSGTPLGLYIAFAHESVFREIAIKIKKKSKKLNSVRLKVTLLKRDEPADRKSHPRMRCWLEVTEVAIVE